MSRGEVQTDQGGLVRWKDPAQEGRRRTVVLSLWIDGVLSDAGRWTLELLEYLL